MAYSKAEINRMNIIMGKILKKEDEKGEAEDLDVKRRARYSVTCKTKKESEVK